MSEGAIPFHMTKSIEQQTLDTLLRIETLLLSRQATTASPNPYSGVLQPAGVTQGMKPKGKHK